MRALLIQEYVKQGVLTITKEEAQQIIFEKSGTGIIKAKRDGTPSNVEWVVCDKIIGLYYDKGKPYKTNKAIIYHGGKGSHIVPHKGSHYD